MKILCIAWLGLGIGMWFAPPGLAQSNEAESRARTAFEWGRDAYDRGRFDEALKHFDYAYSLSGRAALLFNVARAAEGDQQLEKAVRTYDAYLAAMPNAENRAFVEARLAKLRGLTTAPGSTVDAEPAAAARVPAAPAPATPEPTVAPVPVAPPSPAAASEPVLLPVAQEAQQTNPSPSDDEQLLLGLRFVLGGRLAAGGRYDAREKSDHEESEESRGELSVAKGFQIGSAYVWRYLGIGAELRASFLDGKADSEMYWEDEISLRFIDLVVKPQGGYVFRHFPLELYLTVPCGIAWLSVDSSTFSSHGDGQLKVKGNPGATVGVMVGASYLFTRHLGLNFELGQYGYWFKLDRDDSSTHYTLDGSLRQTQVALNLLLRV
jgi:hypothetical protein